MGNTTDKPSKKRGLSKISQSDQKLNKLNTPILKKKCLELLATTPVKSEISFRTKSNDEDTINADISLFQSRRDSFCIDNSDSKSTFTWSTKKNSTGQSEFFSTAHNSEFLLDGDVAELHRSCSSNNILLDGDNLRKSYMFKLIKRKDISEKPKEFNNIVIINWDDCFFCTSYLFPQGLFLNKVNLTENDLVLLTKLEACIVAILSNLIYNNSDIYIISSANEGWIEDSSNTFLPEVKKLLKNNKIKTIYTNKFVDNNNDDKFFSSKISALESFLNLYDNKLISNIICISDSMLTIDALNKVIERYKYAFIKTLKLKENPDIEDLYKQLSLIANQLKAIYGAIRNINIKVKASSK